MLTVSEEMQTEQSPQIGGLARMNAFNSMQAHEQRLKDFARAVAKALEVPEVASYLKEEIGKKFDGDYDALWKRVKDQVIPGQGSLRGLIASNLQGWNGVFNSMAEVEKVPKLQIALPVGFEEWDGVTPIKVAYTPLTVDDVEAEEIYAYDSSGEEYVLDGQTPPDFPIMVVGINERTEEEGNVTFGTLALPCAECGGDGGGGGGGGYGGGTSPPHNEGDWEIFYSLIIYDDHEPWWKGDPEIYVATAGDISGNSAIYEGHFSSINDENRWYYPNANMFRWYTNTIGQNFRFAVLERDFGSFKISGGYEGITVTIEVIDGDDTLGSTLINFRDQYGDQYNVDDAKFEMRYSSSIS